MGSRTNRMHSWFAVIMVFFFSSWKVIGDVSKQISKQHLVMCASCIVAWSIDIANKQLSCRRGWSNKGVMWPCLISIHGISSTTYSISYYILGACGQLWELADLSGFGEQQMSVPTSVSTALGSSPLNFWSNTVSDIYHLGLVDGLRDQNQFILINVLPCRS